MVHAEGEGSHLGSAGEHVGTVQCVEKNFIKLKETEEDSDREHWFPVEWVKTVDDNTVYVAKNSKDFRDNLISENPARA